MEGSGDLEVLHKENAELFKELSETRKAYELNRKAFEESAAFEQDRLKKELEAAHQALVDVEANARKQTEKDTECIKGLQGQLERRLDPPSLTRSCPVSF